MGRVVGVLLACAVVLLAGCAVEGEPSVEPGPPEPTGVQLPPRPRDVRIDGVDPCSLLTAEQRAALGLDQRPVADRAPLSLYGGAEVPACVVRGLEPRAVTVGVSVVTTHGIELFSSGELAADVQPSLVRGFPAVIAIPARLSDFCTIAVDVAHGQLLDIQFGDGGRLPPVPQEELCRGAEQTADAVMATLLAR